MLADPQEEEWAALLEERIKPKLKSLSLQLKLNSLKVQLRKGKLSLNEARQQLWAYCAKNEKMYAADLKAIFKH